MAIKWLRLLYSSFTILCRMPEVLAIQDYSVHTDLVSRTSQLPEFLGLCLGFFLIQSTLRPTNFSNNSTGPHKPMNIIRDSLLAKITWGVSQVASGIWSQLLYASTPKHLCVRKLFIGKIYCTLNIHGIYLQGNNEQ